MANAIYNLPHTASCKMNGLSPRLGNITSITIHYKCRATEHGYPSKIHPAPLVDDGDTDSEQGRTTPVYSPSEASSEQSTLTVRAATIATQSSVGFISADELSRPSLTEDRNASANFKVRTFRSRSPPPSLIPDMLLQLEPCCMTPEQLVDDVKGIYAGLTMVEKKCAEIDQQQASTTNKLSDEQWQALVDLHRTLLHEHYDFFLASHHPSSSPALRRLATKYAMPARLWIYGIHNLLELMRRRLPDSLDQMLAFIYLAYSMMALFMETVPSFEETWIECLGDLARYRMAIEMADQRDREVWSGVARMWYNKAADKSPNDGRIQHHLAVIANSNIVKQLFYYSKALVSAIPFWNARESIMLLFNPFLTVSETASQRYPLVESSLVKANGVLLTHSSRSEYCSLMDQFCSILDNHIGRVTVKFQVQGPEIASSLCAATFDFGNYGAFLPQCFRDQTDPKTKYTSMQGHWLSIGDTAEFIRANPRPAADSAMRDATFGDSYDAAAYACYYLGDATTEVSQRIGDPNVVPYMHVILAYLFGLAFKPKALIYVECYIPWEEIAIFLNTLGRSLVVDSRFEGEAFPQQLSGTGRQLPEDFVMRGLIWAQHYFPADFFSSQLTDEDERNLELPSHAAPRAERCLWLGVQLASVSYR
jgi:hypothetical protein